MTSTTIVPGTELSFADSTSGFTYSLPSPSIVGSGAVLADASDSTYFDLGFSWGHPGGADLASTNRVYARLAAADLTSSGLTVNFRTNEATSGTGLSLPDLVLSFVDKGSGSTEGDFFNTMAWSIRPTVTENSGFTNYTADLTTPYSHFGCTLDDVLALIAAGNCWVQFSADAAGRVNAPGFDGLVECRLSEFSVGSLELPCDTDVALDLSTATLQSGQYVDGVITGLDGTNAQFWFPFEVDPVKKYRVTVTFDPSSAHDGDGDPGTSDRFILIYDAVPGDEGTTGVQVYDGFSNTDDVSTFTIGPGIANWDDATEGVAQGFTRLLFQTSASGAVSAITIRKVCTSFAPPLRLTNRDDMFASARRLTGSSSRQGSNRLTGYL